MKKTIMLMTAALVLALPASGSAAATTVKIVPGAFTPRHVTIVTGDTITWVNNTNARHQVVSDDGNFSSSVLTAGRSYTHTFQAAGRFAYHDSLYPAPAATVTVNGPATDVTLSSDDSAVLYGDGTTLSGKISGADTSGSVVISSRPVGASAQQVATVSTDAGGAFSYTVKPAVQTTYTATWKGATSQPVTIRVHPRVTLARYTPSRLYARIFASVSLADHYVLLQRTTGYGWVTVSRLDLGPRSGRIFKAPQLRGYRTYRVYLTGGQAGPGYLDGTSNKLTVHYRR
jgi:plastocyanin